MIVFKILLSIVATLCLISLSFYIYLAKRGGSVTLYCSGNPRLLSSAQRAFLALALIGFLTCMFKGGEAMLFWVPLEWGGIDENGDYQAVRITLASIFTMLGGFTLAELIDEGTRQTFYLNDVSSERDELRRILKAAGSVTALRSLEEEYKAKIQSLERTIEDKRSIAKTTARYQLPEEGKVFNYSKLIALVGEQIG